MYEDWHVRDFKRIRVPPPSPDPFPDIELPPESFSKAFDRGAPGIIERLLRWYHGLA